MQLLSFFAFTTARAAVAAQQSAVEISELEVKHQVKVGTEKKKNAA
jgi:hypothetical protein